ncbi:hypothetical protein AB6A40_000228 [Gnathostoma spinigerum]|uniref:Uncharacterized protein n=1 Tax=Gnathostoma spinigerum TaxID=75299 RepID=A0ABD6E823_9BILA
MKLDVQLSSDGHFAVSIDGWRIGRIRRIFRRWVECWEGHLNNLRSSPTKQHQRLVTRSPVNDHRSQQRSRTIEKSLVLHCVCDVTKRSTHIQGSEKKKKETFVSIEQNPPPGRLVRFIRPQKSYRVHGVAAATQNFVTYQPTSDIGRLIQTSFSSPLEYSSRRSEVDQIYFGTCICGDVYLEPTVRPENLSAHKYHREHCYHVHLYHHHHNDHHSDDSGKHHEQLQSSSSEQKKSTQLKVLIHEDITFGCILI